MEIFPTHSRSPVTSHVFQVHISIWQTTSTLSGLKQLYLMFPRIWTDTGGQIVSAPQCQGSQMGSFKQLGCLARHFSLCLHSLSTFFSLGFLVAGQLQISWISYMAPRQQDKNCQSSQSPGLQLSYFINQRSHRPVQNQRKKNIPSLNTLNQFKKSILLPARLGLSWRVKDLHETIKKSIPPHLI